jgi:hypothetical protein
MSVGAGASQYLEIVHLYLQKYRSLRLGLVLS